MDIVPRHPHLKEELLYTRAMAVHHEVGDVERSPDKPLRNPEERMMNGDGNGKGNMMVNGHL